MKRERAYKAKRDRLQKKALDLEEKQKQTALRAEALSDLCLLLDSISCLRQHASSLAEDEELTGTPGQQPSVSSGADIHALLEAVPAYCCTADLLFKATPQLVETALSISTADISRLLTHTWLQVLALTELTSSTAPGAGGAALQQQQSELRGLVDGFFGLVTVVMVLHPMPLSQALCLNHRSQQQQETPAAPNWMGMMQRVRLTSQQAAYLATTCQEVKQFRLRTLIQVEQLAQHVSSPSLLLLAAQKESEGQQHRAAPACALADPPAAPASPAVASEVQLSCRLDHLPIYSVLIALAVLDSLTTMQKAQWLAASYPWLPSPLIMCTCAGQLLSPTPEQQAAGHMGSLYTAPDEDPHMQECAACQQHLQQRRQRWQLRQQQGAAQDVPWIGDALVSGSELGLDDMAAGAAPPGAYPAARCDNSDSGGCCSQADTGAE